MSTGETSVGDTIGNLGEWFIDGAVSSLGATGKLLFEDDE
jgi:hypothetical protein